MFLKEHICTCVYYETTSVHLKVVIKQLKPYMVSLFVFCQTVGEGWKFGITGVGGGGYGRGPEILPVLLSNNIFVRNRVKKLKMVPGQLVS